MKKAVQEGVSPMLVFDQVNFAYRRGQPVLRQLSFDIRQGEFVTITGANGSGKSTIAKLMNGLLLPNAGEVRMGALSTLNRQDLVSIRERAGLVFQNPDDQFITASVLDEVVFGLENLRCPKNRNVRQGNPCTASRSYGGLYGRCSISAVGRSEAAGCSSSRVGYGALHPHPG